MVRCIICFDALDPSECGELIKLSCNHTYHATCIADWIKRVASCPQCRQPLPEKDIQVVLRRMLRDMPAPDRMGSLDYSELAALSIQEIQSPLVPLIHFSKVIPVVNKTFVLVHEVCLVKVPLQWQLNIVISHSFKRQLEKDWRFEGNGMVAYSNSKSLRAFKCPVGEPLRLRVGLGQGGLCIGADRVSMPWFWIFPT